MKVIYMIYYKKEVYNEIMKIIEYPCKIYILNAEGHKKDFKVVPFLHINDEFIKDALFLDDEINSASELVIEIPSEINYIEYVKKKNNSIPEEEIRNIYNKCKNENI